MTRLVVGPLLRHAGPDTAAIWVETDQPCDVRVLDTTAHTFTVHGHHYALVQIEGLAPGSDTTYEVALDGETVWPERGTPPSRIRMPGTDEAPASRSGPAGSRPAGRRSTGRTCSARTRGGSRVGTSGRTCC